MYYRYAPQQLTEEQKELICEIAESGRFIGGKFTTAIENYFEEHGFHGVFVNSGSSANLLAAEVFAGDDMRATFPPVCFPTTVAPFAKAGYKCRIASNFSSIWPYTHVADDDSDVNVTADLLGYSFFTGDDRQKGRIEIVDCCDCLFPSKDVLEHADAFTMSWHPAHQGNGIGGGAVYFRDFDDADIARLQLAKSLSMWGRACTCSVCSPTCKLRYEGGWDRRYEYARLGYNLQATEFEAACALSGLQSKTRSKIQQWRTRNWRIAADNLNEPELYSVVKPVRTWVSPFAVLIHLLCDVDVNVVLQNLNDAGVECRPLFTDTASLLHLEPVEIPQHKRLFFITCSHNYTSDVMSEIVQVTKDVLDLYS